MVRLTNTAKEIINKMKNDDRITIVKKYHGQKAMNLIKKVFFGNDTKKANKWSKYWTKKEIDSSLLIAYKYRNKYIARFIIGEGKRMSVLGQKI